MDLNLSLRQTATLSPQMILSCKLLQMNALELREYLQELQLENPTLEYEETPPAGSSEERVSLPPKLEWLHDTDIQNRWYNREDAQDFTDSALNRIGTDFFEESLYIHLKSQIHFESLSPAMAAAVECVLQSLNGAGRLDDAVDALSAYAGVSPAIMEKAIKLVQTLEPAGVGARNLSECLALQLIRDGNTGLALTIVREYLEDMGQNHYNYIAHATGASREEVYAACQLIRLLNPHPGTLYTQRETVNYIIPDLAVVVTEDGLRVIPNDAYIPSLHISSYYHHLMKTAEDPEVKEYLSKKVLQAKQIMQGIEQRRRTLLSCASHIALWQEEFFRLGPGHLHPLTLSETAVELGVHESTVSRAIRGKYLQCAFGTFPLKAFFCQSLPTNGATDSKSAEAAKVAIHALIDGENKKKPLSDQKISELLSVQGFQISRRTVAKYRDEMEIPSTSGRKVFPL